MICFMPYTILEERLFTMLNQTFGKFTVYCPADAIVPDQMRSWEQQGKLNIRCPNGVNAGRLIMAIQNYKAWADLHQGRIGDIAGFLKTQEGRIPMMDDTNPTQIGHQIRHYGESTANETVDPLFMAALFLSMAQEYDEHHQSMIRDMDAVFALEQQMLKQLSGDLQDVNVDGLIEKRAGALPDHQAIDPYMTSQRVQAWCRLVFADAQAPLLYLTPSKAAAEHMLDIFPVAVEIGNKILDGTSNQSRLSPSQIRETLENLAFDADPQPLEFDPEIRNSLSENGVQLTLYCLPRVSSFAFLTRLAVQEPSADEVVRKGQGPKNTLIGLVTAA